MFDYNEYMYTYKWYLLVKSLFTYIILCINMVCGVNIS